jgi:hypothetical protein
MRRPETPLLAATLLFCVAVSAETPYPAPTPSALSGLDYELPIYPEGADHDPAVPSPDAVLGFPAGRRAATPEQIVAYARAVADASDRVQLVEYARSYEGRPLVYLVISSPANLGRSADIQAGMAALADPRRLEAARRARLIDELPAVAWLAYSIHGNESSGSDASLVVIHHLAADRSEATQRLLEEVVVIVDPNMNPDGRARFVKSLAETRGTQPNVDDQSVLHTGYWPYGRGNHYLFDLNRDWIYARHPETRGRIREIATWRPLLFVDAHEMGAQDTYLFSPAREPHNPHLPPYRRTLGETFAEDQGRAFDRYGYPYYSGEWHEDWYPGYTDAWASLRGAVGILYEQARMAEDGVQRPSNLLSYRQSVHHQVISSLANLETLRRERRAVLEAFSSDRLEVASSRGPYGNHSFVILPTDNYGRLNDLLDLLRIQGFEAHRLTRELRVGAAVDQLGRQLSNQTLPAGSIVLRNRQPEARLLAAMFEFDPLMSDAALAYERERVLRTGRSTIYDTTAWNISMMFGLEALTVPQHLEAGLEPLDLRRFAAEPRSLDTQAIALAVSGADDRALAFAARMMERGYFVRANGEPSELNGHALPTGSIAVTRDDNRRLGDWQTVAREVAGELGVALHPIGHARAPGALADLGGRQWRLLPKPNIALLTRGMNNMLDFGATWYLLDHRLGIRHSHLDEDRIGAFDLRRYNVIYLPERWGQAELPQALVASLGDWVRAGGTLIAVGNAARALMDGDAPMVATRPIEAVIGEDEIAAYQDAIHREWLAEQPLPAGELIWGNAATPGTGYPWMQDEEEAVDAEERRRRDAWQAMLMPSGALVATRVDPTHWLAAGTGRMLPVLYSNSPVLMASPPVESPFRIGVYHGREAEAGMLNWAPIPAQQELIVRMSGLLWPEARQRIASSAWVTRESVGRGQVILFAHAPAFRAAQLGAIRVLENALVLGPGMGANQPVPLP